MASQKFYSDIEIADSSSKVLIPAGSDSSPSFSFTGDTNTGIYSAAANAIGFAADGGNRLTVNPTTVTSVVPFNAPAGSVSAPSYSWSTGPSTGMYHDATWDVIRFAINGSEVLSFQDDQVLLNSGIDFIVNNGHAVVLSGWVVAGQGVDAVGPILTTDGVIIRDTFDVEVMYWMDVAS